MKKTLSVILLTLLLAGLPLTVYAHPGATDDYGGHHDYDNVSGLGDYHYHHGHPAHLHPDGVCPYDYDDQTDHSPGASSSSVRSASASTQQLLDESIQREEETRQRAIAAEQEARDAQLLAEQMEGRAERTQGKLDELKRRSTVATVCAGAVFLLLILLLRRSHIIGEADRLHIQALESKIGFYEELFPRLKDIDNMPRDEARAYVRRERERREQIPRLNSGKDGLS